MESLSFFLPTIPETSQNLDPLLLKPHRRKLPTVAHVDGVLAIFYHLSQLIWFTWRNTMVLNFFFLVLPPLHGIDSSVFIHALVSYMTQVNQKVSVVAQGQVGRLTFPPPQRCPGWSESLSTLVPGQKLGLFTLRSSALKTMTSFGRPRLLCTCVACLEDEEENMQNGERTPGRASKVPRWEG